MTSILCKSILYTSDFSELLGMVYSFPKHSPIQPLSFLTCTQPIFYSLAPRIPSLPRAIGKYFGAYEAPYDDFFEHLVIADRSDSKFSVSNSLKEKYSLGAGQDELMPDNVFIDGKTLVILGMADSFVFTRSLILVSANLAEHGVSAFRNFAGDGLDCDDDDDDEVDEIDEEQNSDDGGQELDDDEKERTAMKPPHQIEREQKKTFLSFREKVRSVLFKLFQLETFALSDETENDNDPDNSLITDEDLKQIFTNNSNSLEHLYFQICDASHLSFSDNKTKNSTSSCCDDGESLPRPTSLFSLLPHLQTLDFGDSAPSIYDGARRSGVVRNSDDKSTSGVKLENLLNSLSSSPFIRKNLRVLRMRNFRVHYSEHIKEVSSSSSKEIFRLVSFPQRQDENSQQQQQFGSYLYFTHLRKLDLGYFANNHFDDEMLACIQGQEFPSLEWLSLDGQKLISDEGIEKSIPTLAASLTHLNLSEMDANRVTNKSMEFIGECEKLRSLMLCDFEGGRTTVPVARGRGRGGTPAMMQVAGGGEIYSSGIEKLQNLKSLTYLDLREQRRIDTTAMMFLARHNSSLKHLGLAYCNGVSGLHFPNDFSGNSSESNNNFLIRNLESINLSSSSGYVDRILSDLCYCENLKRINLHQCSTHLNEAALLNFFHKNNNKRLKFEEIRLSGLEACVTDRVVDSICSNYATTLRYLDLECGYNPMTGHFTDSQLTPASLKSIGEKLISHPNGVLEVLHLRGNNSLASSPDDWVKFFDKYISVANHNNDDETATTSYIRPLYDLGIDEMGNNFTNMAIETLKKNYLQHRQKYLPCLQWVRLYSNKKLSHTAVEKAKEDMPEVGFWWCPDAECDDEEEEEEEETDQSGEDDENNFVIRGRGTNAYVSRGRGGRGRGRGGAWSDSPSQSDNDDDEAPVAIRGGRGRAQ